MTKVGAGRRDLSAYFFMDSAVRERAWAASSRAFRRLTNQVAAAGTFVTGRFNGDVEDTGVSSVVEEKRGIGSRGVFAIVVSEFGGGEVF